LTDHRFPDSFLWGSATSSFQIEGAATADGRGVSIWDTFSRQPGKVLGGDTGDVACDHFHRYADDVQLMKQLGLQAYRFSVAWPRVLPFGTGTPVAAGLDFYSRLVDALLEVGIEPWITLYHWDLPQALQDRGGWPQRSTVDAFVNYADVVARHLGDRVTHWITHNEPWCAAVLGYQNGLHAPGWNEPAAALAAAHHLLLSHGRAVPVIRSHSKGAQVGITLNVAPAEPASPSAADAAATERMDAHFNRWYFEPLIGKGYPEVGIADHREQGIVGPGPLPFIEPGDMEQIAVEIDFLGINYYSRAVVRCDRVSDEDNAPRTIPEAPAERKTDIGWEVWPDGLYAILRRLGDEMPVPIYITENGAAYSTGPGPDGEVHDTRRVAYLAGHIDACWRAIEDGVDLRGYFVWSLMDNFEWQEGYSQRFGVVWVDFETQQRTPKDSAWFFRDVVAANAALPMP